MRWVYIVTVLGTSSALALAQTPTTATAEGLPEIETVGSGERRVPPDRATVTLVVVSQAPSAGVAASNNARAVAAVRDTLRKLGLENATSIASYNVGPDYEMVPRSETPRRAGYVARSAVRVQLSQLDQVGRVIDAGLARGATGVEGVFFEASTAEEARRAAMAEAAASARRDAEALARSLGGTVGPLLSVSTAGAMDARRMNVAMRMGYGGGAGNTVVTPNEIVVAAGVVTRWRFVAGAR
jgi:uncharacterized protein YggE